MKNQVLKDFIGCKNYQLNNFEEIIGLLDKIEINKKHGLVTLVITFKRKIDIPIKACDKDILVSSLGKKIAIIRVDNNYKIRPIKNKNVEN